MHNADKIEGFALLTNKGLLMMRQRQLIATFSYIAMIVVLNTCFVYFPTSTAYGQTFSSADMLVGSIYIVRDFAQREIKHAVFLAMLVGAGISYLLANKTIAIASLSAFVVGEILDWAIYTFTKRPLSQRLVWSSIISAPVDSFVFLSMVSAMNWLGFSAMVAGKMAGVFLLWGVWKWLSHRKRLREGAYRVTIT